MGSFFKHEEVMFFQIILFQLLKAFLGPRQRTEKEGRTEGGYFFIQLALRFLEVTWPTLARFSVLMHTCLLKYWRRNWLVVGTVRSKARTFRSKCSILSSCQPCVGVIGYVDKLIYFGGYFFIFPNKRETVWESKAWFLWLSFLCYPNQACHVALVNLNITYKSWNGIGVKKYRSFFP